MGADPDPLTLHAKTAFREAAADTRKGGERQGRGFGAASALTR
jgi:hypothetical protein